MAKQNRASNGGNKTNSGHAAGKGGEKIPVSTGRHELLEFDSGSSQSATIKVIGVGGAGGNALNTMIESNLSGVEFIAGNTDNQALQHNKAPLKIQLGAEVTGGLGCGANPDRGRAAGLESRDRLREILEGADMVFVTAGMGGGTGTGCAPIVAEVAREIGALTVAVVTKPFMFEGKVRTRHAERGIDELHGVVDTLITIPNQRLLALAGKNASMKDAFKLADEVLLNAVRGISDLITIHGLINLDFADVRTVMNEAGVALMGTGVGTGEGGAADAARAAISSPLLEDLSIDGARGVLINITGSESMSLFEVNEASCLVQEAAHEDANIIFGAVIDCEMPEDEIRVTVIATGLDDKLAKRRTPVEDQPQLQSPASVTQIRRDPEPVQGDLPAAMASDPPRAEESEQSASEALLREEDGFASPFDDELDIPTFLRKRSEEAAEDDKDESTPAFMRRAQD